MSEGLMKNGELRVENGGSVWREVRLGGVLEVKYGKDHKKLQDGLVPCYGTGGIMRYVNDELYNEESILIPRKGSLNNIYYINEPFWTVDTLFWTKIDKDKVFSKFLFYQLTLIDFTILNVGSAVPSLTVPVLNEIDITLPPLPEQKAIAEVLSALDDKIDLLHRQNKTLEQMAETLFRQWFVVEAGEDWEFTSFSKWILETVGGDWGKEKAEGDFLKPVICIRGTDIANLNISLADKAPIRYVKEVKFEKIEPKNGDIIIEISGGTETQSTGRATYINDDVRKLFIYPLVFSNFSRLIRISKPEYSYFIYCYFQYLYKKNEFFNLENGSSGIKNLDYKTLLFELEFFMPEESLVIKFNSNVSSYFKKINKNKQQIRTLQSLCDTLLPKLMSGEVRVVIPTQSMGTSDKEAE